MTDVIKLVAGDGRPVVRLTLTDETTGDPIDVSGVNTTVSVAFRERGTVITLATITCTVLDGTNGIVSFDFTGGTLDSLAAGEYEGEIIIDFDGDTHTLYDLLKFRLRERF